MSRVRIMMRDLHTLTIFPPRGLISGTPQRTEQTLLRTASTMVKKNYGTIARVLGVPGV